MILALILYIIGFVCMGIGAFAMICLGGSAPRAHEWAFMIVAVIFWPIAMPWFMWKIIRPLLRSKTYR